MEERAEEPAECLEGARPYFSFGVIADIQYSGTKPNGLSSWRVMRYFQHTLLHLQEAIAEWRGEEPPPKFVLQLGDVVDASNRRAGRSEEALEAVLKEIEDAGLPFHHVWGNHELYNFNRDFMRRSKLNTSGEGGRDGADSPPDYYVYDFAPHATFRVLVLDTYDLSVFGRREDSRGYQESLDFLDRAEEENCSGRGSNKHLVDFNGGVSSNQLSWLDETLTYCDQQNERVIIAGHTPIHPEAQRTMCLAWNYEDILRVLHAHRCVVCYIAGHEHRGGYHQDSHGIHHVTMEGVIESPPDSNAFGTVDVYEDRLVLRGRGRVQSRVLVYREAPPTCCCVPALHLRGKRESSD